MKKLMTAIALIALVAFAAPAFAANPFMDVPAGHWAYDAVEQLAARGVISGYPDGSYKGPQPATRYEMASIVARALAYMNMEKASKQDVELLKKLVLEFKNELDALGVKVNDLDKRVAVLEDGVGGWKIRGIFKFDAKFGHSDKDEYAYTNGKENQFTKERFRLFLTKSIDENSYFYAEYRTGDGDEAGQGDSRNNRWTHLFVDTKIFWDIDFRVGRFAVDFEDDYGLYTDNDAIFGDIRTDGFRLKKSFGMLNATAVVGRNNAYDVAAYTIPRVTIGADGEPVVESTTVTDNGSHMSYILDLSFTPSEKFFIGATGYWFIEDSAREEGDWDLKTYGIYAGYNFTPNIGVKGIYYFQDLGDSLRGAKIEDSPRAWKAIIDVKQDALKFTSLWVEYSEQDNTFFGLDDRYAIGGGSYDYVGRNRPTNKNTTKFIFATAKQQWNDKFSTFLRFARADFDTKGIDDATEWGIGVGYQYTPAIYFELMYDQVDHGNGAEQVAIDKESVVRFRTSVSF